MPKYKVVRQIEHNRKIYVPATAPSAADGAEIPVDASGLIELSEQEASLFTQGQIRPASESSSSAGGGGGSKKTPPKDARG